MAVTTRAINGRTYEVYRPVGHKRGGNAAVAISGHLTDDLRGEISHAGRQLNVDQVAVWRGDEVIAMVPAS